MLFVKQGESLSLQFHREKDESWLIQSGRAKIELGAVGESVLKTEVVGPGAAFHYAPGTVHRITAIEDTTILEVSTPHLDDVVRLRRQLRPHGHLGAVGARAPAGAGRARRLLQSRHRAGTREFHVRR